MFSEKLLICAVLLSTSLLQLVHAFWWAQSPETTTTESPQLALKQVPLTYFRTYTYQPLAGGPLAGFPFFHHIASALPPNALGGGTARYDHNAYMPGAGFPMSLALQQQQQQQFPTFYQLPQQPLLQLRPLQSPVKSTSTTTTRRPTTTRSTTTTTTTTTTPPPTTTPRTTTTTTSANDVRSFSSYASNGAQPYPYPYPTFNRRAYMGYNSQYYRAAYPYPDYTLMKSTPTEQYNNRGGQVQFVPCMCPLSVSAASVESNAALLLQGRTTGVEDDNENLTPLDRSEDMNLPADASTISKQMGGVEKKEDVAGTPKSKGERLSSLENIERQKLSEKVANPAQGQLSTKKIDAETVRATKETEQMKFDKETAVVSN